MRRIAVVMVALVVATSASAQHSYGRQECKGTLLQDPDGSLSIQVPPEGLCEISPSRQEITRVLLVRRR
jgi:hypothetical protein